MDENSQVVNGIHIRRAERADAPVILEMIQALAVYEKEPDAVETTIADIERDGFGDNPLFHCLIAEWEGQAAGFAVFFYKWSTWRGRATLHLEDLFVPPKHRGRGIGKALLRKLAATAVANDCPRFEWEVLDWNDLARDFYHALGAYHREGWYPYRIEGKALKRLAGAAKVT
jgi:GNAT superfamily N-acetyltransferase